MHVREDCPAQLGGIFTSLAEQLRQRALRLQFACQRFELEPGSEGEAANLVVEVAGVSGVNQQVAGGMPYQDTSGRRAKGKVAERFSSFHPTGGDAGDGGDRRRDSDMGS